MYNIYICTHFFKHQKIKKHLGSNILFKAHGKETCKFHTVGSGCVSKLSSQDWLLRSKIGLLQAPHQMYISCTSVR